MIEEEKVQAILEKARLRPHHGEHGEPNLDMREVSLLAKIWFTKLHGLPLMGFTEPVSEYGEWDKPTPYDTVIDELKVRLRVAGRHNYGLGTDLEDGVDVYILITVSSPADRDFVDRGFMNAEELRKHRNVEFTRHRFPYWVPQSKLTSTDTLF